MQKYCDKLQIKQGIILKYDLITKLQFDFQLLTSRVFQKKF